MHKRMANALNKIVVIFLPNIVKNKIFLDVII